MEEEVRAQLKFFGVNGTEKHALVVYCNSDGKIYIEIDMDGELQPSYIALNRATAIKLSKTLRTEISYIES